MSDTLPEFIYILIGMGAGRSMECVSVEKYKVKRQTPKRWYVFCRGGEDYFTKDRGHMYLTLDEVESALRNEKRRRLAAAQRLVEALQETITVNIHDIPPVALERGDIQL